MIYSDNIALRFVLFVIVPIVGNLENPILAQTAGERRFMYTRLWSMAVIAFMMKEIHLTYRDMAGHPNPHRDIVERLGPNSVPAKSTIHSASARIPKSYR